MNQEAELFRRVYYDLINAKNNTYYGHKKYARYDGGVSSDGRRHNAIWPKLAAKLVDQGIDIEDYLEEIVPRKEIHRPHDAVKDEYIREYLQDTTKNRSDVLALWTEEEKLLLKNIQTNRMLGDTQDVAMRRAISDPALTVSPLVRYCFARLNGYSDAISASLANDAMEQYKRSKRVYDKVCPDRIPEWWRKSG